MNGIAPFFVFAVGEGFCFSPSTTLSLSPLYFSSLFPPPFSSLFSLSFRFPYSIKRCSLHFSPHHNLARFCGLVFLQAAEAIDAGGGGGAYLRGGLAGRHMAGAQRSTRGGDEQEVGACGVGVAEGYVYGGTAAHDKGRHAHGAGGCLYLPDGACGLFYLVEDGRLDAVLIAVERQIDVAAYGYDKRGVEVDGAFKTAVERDV